MAEMIHVDDEYKNWINGLVSRYRSSQIKAAVKVNQELLRFYWNLGKDITDMNAESKYGDSFFKKLSRDLRSKLPDAKCFSETNIRYMRRFYSTYNQLLTILPQVGAEFESRLFSIPWGHHKLILDKFKNYPEKAWFFANRTVANNWSRAVLMNFIDTDLYERQGKAISNFSSALPVPQGDLAQELTRDPYNFNFLTLDVSYDEKDLKEALVRNISKFLMELGTGFAYMGREYRIVVGNKEQFIDLLFYNTTTHCYIVIEVKVTEFEGAHLGQLSSYVSCVNHLLRKEGDNPTIGLLICKSKDNVFAQYSLEGYNQPLGISEFKGINLLPEDYKRSLPSIEEIESELKNKV